LSWLWATLAVISGGLGAVVLWLTPLFHKDLEEGIPRLAVQLVRRAVRQLPAEHRERYEEEWLAELQAVPGVMTFKLTMAVRITCRARSTGRAIRNTPSWVKQCSIA
jgi:hypothetical protein